MVCHLSQKEHTPGNWRKHEMIQARREKEAAQREKEKSKIKDPHLAWIRHERDRLEHERL